MPDQNDVARWASNHRAASLRAAEVRRATTLTPDAYLERAFEVIQLANECGASDTSATVSDEDLKMYRGFARLRKSLGVGPR